MIYILKIFIFIILSIKLLLFNTIQAKTKFKLFNLLNNKNKIIISLYINKPPNYIFFLLHQPERLILDIYKKNIINNIIIKLNQKKLKKNIHFFIIKKNKKIRIIFYIYKNKKNNIFNIILNFIIKKNYNINLIYKNIIINSKQIKTLHPIQIILNSNYNFYKKNNFKRHNFKKIISFHKNFNIHNKNRIIIVIDAGHGGQDPGAIGNKYGLKEKNTTILVSKFLQKLLNNNSHFKAILTRNNDYFISIIKRTNLARKNNANVLISIHTDATINHHAKGISVWILSNHRANTEIIDWIKQHRKKYTLLNNSNYIFSSNYINPYLSQTILDLQFNYTRHVGYNIAKKILQELKYINLLHKPQPEYANFGILKSLDIPSILIEIGFISNNKEEYLLGNNHYQYKIAKAIYNGLCNYFLKNP
ncbi:N-acetylmuramoyl-L-alanine amidase AmiB [Serratia symbiotica]|nr:N-acetylmuramoyl-L-alanine amidase AmiB [Serratia symbiotica]